jgi:hypothetical protein
VTAAAPARVSAGRPRLAELDLTLVTVLAIAWLSAVAATCVTLWLLVGVIGKT